VILAEELWVKPMEDPRSTLGGPGVEPA